MTSAVGARDIPPSIRVELAHAAVCLLAGRSGVELLVVKGPGMDPLVAFEGRASSDVDVLVRPDQVEQFLQVTRRHGWMARDRFETGSPFGHSTTLFHPTWGDLDVHRLIPGIGATPGDAFAVLWGSRVQVTLAGHPCPHPSAAAQALVLVLHAARSEGAARAARDVAHAWSQAPAERQADILALVDRLDAHVAWAAATGDLEAFRDARTYRLWRIASRGGGRLEEWRARVEAEASWRGKVAITLRAPLVNTDHMAMLLGRRPTRAEVLVEFVDRFRRGAVELAARRGRSRS
jgi:hypothetical protein